MFRWNAVSNILMKRINIFITNVEIIYFSVTHLSFIFYD